MIAGVVSHHQCSITDSFNSHIFFFQAIKSILQNMRFKFTPAAEGHGKISMSSTFLHLGSPGTTEEG